MLPRPGAPATFADNGAPASFADVAEWERLGWGVFAIVSDPAFLDGHPRLLRTQPE